MRKYKAFTLSEVLLVLAIIGTIAAVTVPVVMQQSTDKKFAALGKKALATLQNAIDTKLALVPINAGRANMGLFQWLANGERWGQDAIKVTKHNNWRVMQTPDGIIWDEIQRGAIDSNSKLGRSFIYRIDLNGSEGPTNSTVETGISGAGYANNARHFDVIYVRITSEGNIETHGNTLHGDAEDDRALIYFGHQVR